MSVSVCKGCWSVDLLHQSGVPLTSVDTGGGGGLHPAELDGAQRGGGCRCCHKELPPFSLTGRPESQIFLFNVSNILTGFPQPGVDPPTQRGGR